MMVLTRYMGPTDNRGARVQVTLGSGRKVYVPWDHALDAPQMHAKAALDAINGASDVRGTFVVSHVPEGTPYSYAVTLVRRGRRSVVRDAYGQVFAQ